MFILHISTVSVKCKRIDNFKKSDTLKEKAFYSALEKPFENGNDCFL